MARRWLQNNQQNRSHLQMPLEKLQVSIDELKVQWDTHGGYGQFPWDDSPDGLPSRNAAQGPRCGQTRIIVS